VRPSLPSPVDHLFAALQKVHSGALGRLEQSSSIRFKSGVPPDSTSVVKPPGEEPNIPTREGSRGWCHGKERQLTEVRLREHNLDRGNSPNEFENSIVYDRRPAHPRGCSLRCTRRVACRLHPAGSEPPATTCPSRSFSCTGDVQFGGQAVGWGHGYVASMDWL
jgi:hypothetical protein